MSEQTNYYIALVRPLSNDQSDDMTKIKKAAFEQFDCQGMEEFSLDEADVDELLGERAYGGGDVPLEVLDDVENSIKYKNLYKYKFYFYDCIVDNFKSYVIESFPKINITTAQEPWKDWNEEWMKEYKPITVTNKIKIVPSWYKFDGNQSEDDIYINPGMAFGTGGHETTFLCLKLIDSIDESDLMHKSCLDFGCGSGILGITFLKLFKGPVEFCDIDKKALDNCKQNLLLNFEKEDLDGQRLVSRERFVVEKKFQIVFANILEHILLEEKKILTDLVIPDGYLVTSGILNNQVTSLIDSYTKNNEFTVEQKLEKGEWSAILFKKV
ncbi:MAG: 50S ribosomal protein L11 methyltransferase [Bacteriovoracaceae bacterium]|nr:50S ribosomal protein L11 methyltransferase [Bacteriovoracaceae bacterium]